MNRPKQIISWFLISLYALVMAHNLLPHDHQRNKEWADVFGVIISANYPHTTTNHSSHDHSHGFFDFLTSLFNGFDHEDLGPAHFEHFVKEDHQVNIPVPFYELQAFVVPQSLSCQVIPNHQPQYDDSYKVSIPDSPPVGPNGARGPPIHS